MVPKPPDWGDEICITGYWFLDTASQNDWKPPKELIEFIKETHQNENKIIVIEELSSELADYLKEESDFDLHGFSFSIDAYAVKHILKNHRDKAKENAFSYWKGAGL